MNDALPDRKAELLIMHNIPNPDLNANHLKSVLRLNNNHWRFIV